ncbi:MAG: HD domain-containing protein, partial [Actinomycetota bacterium]|nr:HD domain-containing protein [Actinomycetota bacterium]
MKQIKLPIFDDIKRDPVFTAHLEQADMAMGALGYTEHGFRHADLVAHISANIMRHLSFPERQAELAAIAGYLHDIGCSISRSFHGVSGALLAKPLLENKGLTPKEVAVVLSAIGNHEEEHGWATSEVSAALIL